MKLRLNHLLVFLTIISFVCFPQKKFLFDASHTETAGNADWVIDEDSNVPGRYPTPDQSTVTSSTPENYWTGALSSWGIALVKLGHHVETLPIGSTITYGTANAQDLKNYDVFVIDEPNNLFTAAEKTALIAFVQNGGGLFMISDHTGSDRNNDGKDSPAIWNDLFTNNGLVNNPFGMAVDLTNIVDTTSNVAAGDYLITGSAGTVTKLSWNNGATATLNTTANSTVTGVVWTRGTSHGSTGLMVARAKYGTGRVVLVCDSSPADDGSGASGNNLFNGWLDPLVNGSHAALHMNGSLWLAKILEPASAEYYYSKSTGNLDVLSTWNSAKDGSGTSPASFSTAGQKYIIQNNRTSATITSPLTIASSGTGSKIIIGDSVSVTPVTFIVPSGSSFSGTIDVTSNGVLSWADVSAPTLGILNAASTVNYSYTGTYTVPSSPLNYGNLTLTGGTKIFSSVAYTLAGNLIFDGATNCNGGTSPYTTINLAGNYTLQNSAAFDTSQANRLTLVCNGSSSQTLTGNGKEIILSRLTVSNSAGVVLSGASGSNLTVGNLSGGGITFTTPGNFINVNNNKVTFYAGKASITGTGTFTAGSNAEFIFNNITSSANAMGTFSLTVGSQTIKNLTINLASTTIADKVLTLGSPATVTGTLTLTTGYITTTSSNPLTLGSAASVSGGSANSYIDGPLARTFAASGSALFTIGKITPSNAYRPITFSVTQGAGTNIYTAEQKEGANPGGSSLSGTLNSKSSVRYYTITKSGPAAVSASSLLMSYGSDDGVGSNNSALRIAHDSGSVWRDLGGIGSAPSTGTITSAANFTSFGDFILAFNTSRALTLKAYLEGPFDGTVMENDVYPLTVTIELHDAGTNALVESKTGDLSSAGVAAFTFTTAINGAPYYIVIKSANTLEVQSAAGQSFTAGALNYDFTTGIGQAYNDGSGIDPMILKGGKWCLYSGDVNQDGAIDAFDLSPTDNDNVSGGTPGIPSGLSTDITGDGGTDAFDLSIIDNNNSRGVYVQLAFSPVAAKSIKRSILQLENKNKSN